jgi:glutathione-independent formaldehyde dehydrogenase
LKAVVYKDAFNVAVEEVPELPLTEAPAAYEKFDKRIDGYTKVLLHPAV